MDDEIKPLLYCRRPCNPKFHCCLWAARLGPVDKNQTLTQRKLDRALCNIEIWGLGVYLVGVCRVWSVCPSTVSMFPTLKKSFCWSPWCIRFQHCKGPWPQRTMTAKHNDGKAQWLQRTMTAKRNDRKERWLQENNDCNKAMTAKNRPLQRAVLEVWSLPRKLRFHIFNLQILKEVSHESFHCTTSTCRFWRKSRTKASIAQLQLADFEGRARESFPLHNFNLQVLKRKSRTQARSGGQNAPHHRPEPCQPIVAQIPVFILPNSKLYFLFCYLYYITYSYCLIPITYVFAVKVGLLSPCVQKHREKDNLFFSCKRLSTVYLRKHK